MKKIFSALVAAMLAMPALAQFSSGGFELDKQNLYYGVRLGATIANLSGEDVDTDSKLGMTLGAVVGMRISETTPIFLESGLYYTERGAKDIGYSNVEIPLLIKYGFKATDEIGIVPFFGPYFARACWGKTKIAEFDAEGKATGKSVKVGTFDEKKWTGLKRMNMGFKIGCAAEYNKLYLELGYQIGVTNISKNDDATIHSNALFANVGVNF